MKKMMMTLALFLTTLTHAAVPDTTAVWKHHLAAWNEKNLDAITADYDDSAVLIIRNHVFHGRNEIHAAFEYLFETFDRASSAAIDPATIRGKVVYITWHATIDGDFHAVGSDTFVVENGKITYQTIATDSRIFPWLNE